MALWDQWRFEHDIIATWEGAPNGLSRRAVSFDIDQNSFTPQYGLFPLDTGLTAGARVTVTYDEVDTTCTGSHSATLETLAEASLTVSGLSTTINSCLSATGVQISVHPNDGFSVKDTQHGNLGNVYANSSGEFSLTLGHWQTKLTLEAQNEWEQGDTVVISIVTPSAL